MKLLLTSPPSTAGGYVNLCYQYVELGEVGGYLRQMGHDVVILDGTLMPHQVWNQEFIAGITDTDALIIHHNGDNLASAVNAARQARKYARLPIATYGIVSTFSPRFFSAEDFDYVVTEGDWEAWLGSWLQALDLSGSILPQSPWRLEADEWAFPALDLLPLERYRQAYQAANQIAGVANSFELSCSVSRGCVYRCWFCPAAKIDGDRERRRSVSSVLDFLESAQCWGFTHFAAFSACFTQHADWVREFCEGLLARDIALKWRCVTTLSDIELDLIPIMARSGCYRIGFGVETLNQRLLMKIGKPVALEQIEHIIQTCHDSKVIPMCFLLDELPLQPPGEAQQDAAWLAALGAKVRVSKYIDYHAAWSDDRGTYDFSRKVSFS